MLNKHFHVLYGKLMENFKQVFVNLFDISKILQ